MRLLMHLNGSSVRTWIPDGFKSWSTLVRFLGSNPRVPRGATGPTETCKRTKRRRAARLAF
eukprot:scaffold2631_cov373-Pavlova_lutheri.AAC.4